LSNKKVLLVPTLTPGSRTKYALLAAPFKRSYLLLNTSMANLAVINSLCKPRFSYLGKRNIIFSEHRIDDYKTDLFIQDTNTVIEIKSIISTNDYGIFPTVYSERAIKQLKKLQGFLTKGSDVTRKAVKFALTVCHWIK
jgi:DNA-binding sugar fermentation-stimulating protein